MSKKTESRAWFTVDELNAWADKKLKENPHWAEQPAPPPECQTEAEKTAFAFGWWKALEHVRQQPAQQEPVERGGLRFYTNGTERQHWKADGSIDFKDKQGNVTMTIAAGSITSPPASKPMTDEEIWKFWWSRPEVPDGEDDSMEAEFVAAVRRILAAHGIKENT